MRRDLMKKIAGIVLIAVLIVSFRLVRTLVSMRAPGALLPYLLAHYLLMGAGLALLGVAAANQLAWVYVGPYRGACRAWRNRSVPRWNTAWRRAARFCSISSSG